MVPGIILIVLIRKKWLISLDRPLDHGVRFAGKPLFGRNKTYRGALVYIGGAILMSFMLSLALNGGADWVHWLYGNNPLIVGTLFGLSYVFGELVNSFMKRRVSIKPGEVSKRFTLVQRVIDLSDGPIMATLVLVAVFGPSPQSPIALVVGVVLHWFAERIMLAMRLKKK